MRYAATQVRLDGIRYWGVWDTEKFKLVEQTRSELSDTSQQAHEVAQKLNTPPDEFAAEANEITPSR
ncbi:hypothetical protein SD71_16070 [Cohnella kolymensis]|uniref:Uncharacterized protein n=1 Tax=Cohnella kolymensis TaxID=1590652 RepID=A0ABR5A260_9BACL|nr:hypothetical protein [Cohnella kolymensis]KIL35144.1 hypothetical protein SD71_16070 [Cohnella kolymensis]